jgi:hypothetical protein
MAIASRAKPAREANTRAGGGGRRATVFGLDVRSRRLPPLLEHSRAGATGRELEISAARPGELQRELAREPSRRVCVRSGPDGRDCFRIERCGRGGYLIWGRDRGSYLIDADGGRLRLAPHGSAYGWQRFLIGQVLPFAALLRGLEIFHAGAVSLDGGVVAVTGGSGAGKTSLALALCRRGAGFVADDVLALEASSSDLLAHPGCPLAGVDRREAARLSGLGLLDFGRALGGDERELLHAVEAVAGPLPLRALLMLERSARGAGPPRFEAVEDPRRLLACTFNFVLDAPARMLGLLEACALAARGRVERVLVNLSTDADELAEAVLARLAGSR